MHTCIRKPASLFIISLLCGLMMRQPALADDNEDVLQKMEEKAKAISLISHEDAKTGKANQPIHKRRCIQPMRIKLQKQRL